MYLQNGVLPVVLIRCTEELAAVLPGAEPQLDAGWEAVRLEGQGVLDVALGVERGGQGRRLAGRSGVARQALAARLQETSLAQTPGPAG